MNLFDIQLVRFAAEVHVPTLMTTSSTSRLNDSRPPFLSRAPPHFSPTLCPDRGTLEPSCTPARVSHATLAPMHHSPHPFCSAGPSFAPPARACSCAKLEPSRVPCTPFRPVLATPGVAGDDFWRNLYVQNGAVSTGLLSSCDPASAASYPPEKGPTPLRWRRLVGR